MKEIQKGVARQDGIIVVWQGDLGQNRTFVAFEDLIAMKINATDLVLNPQNYRIDEETQNLQLVCGISPRT